MVFLISLLFPFLLALLVTPLVRRFAYGADVVDSPNLERKKHGRYIPLMGAMAIFAAIWVSIGVAILTGYLPGAHIQAKYVAGLFLALTIIIVGGALDDRYSLTPKKQMIWPALAILVIIGSGIGMTSITNPLGGIIYLDKVVTTVLWWDGLPYHLTLFADAFTLLWLLGMSYTTKLLDGVDGLVSGVTVIGALVIAAVSMMQEVSQPDTAMLALIVAGAFGGFLIYNMHPAKIFLGEGGSVMAGFLLGVLAIISGGKIATTLLILALPIFDAAIVIGRRYLSGVSITKGDRSHLHFLLVDAGFSQKQVVLFFYFIAASFGVSTLVLRGPQKMIALAVVVGLIAIVSIAAIVVIRKKQTDVSSKAQGK